MNTFDAVFIAEGVEESDEERWIEAWQLLVDTGVAFQLQGWFGRTAIQLIADGVIEAPQPPTTKKE